MEKKKQYIIPENTLIERMLPINIISELALKEGNRKKPIYELHKWWARRLSIVTRSLLIGSMLPADATEEQFWTKFYSKNDIDMTVMDCFMGGGTSLVEAKKIGAKTIGIDIDPLACFVTKKELENCNYEEIEKEYILLKSKIGEKIKSFYYTEIDGKSYPIINVFWAYEVECEKCHTNFTAHPHYKLYYNKKYQIVFCKKCGTVEKIDINDKKLKCTKCNEITDIEEGNYKRGYCTCPECSHKFKISERILGTQSLKMFALEYENGVERCFKQTGCRDLEIYKEICDEAKRHLDKLYIPNKRIQRDNSKDKRPVTHGYIYYKDLFNMRQLYSLAILYNYIIQIKDVNIREFFLIVFSDCLASNNMLCNYAYGYRKLTPLFGIHAYTVPIRPVENNVWGASKFGRGTFDKTYIKALKAKKYCEDVYEHRLMDKGKIVKIYTGEIINSTVTNEATDFYERKCDTFILNGTSEKMNDIKNKSIDLILTDPPYYDNFNYSELADFYTQWIGEQVYSTKTEAIKESLFVDNLEERNHDAYEQRISTIFTQCRLKLKDEGLMVFSYHHNKREAWVSIGNAIKNSGLIVTNVFPIRSEGESGYHSSENSIKWDSILVLRKKIKKQVSNLNNLEELISKWIELCKEKNLVMKRCDYISFFRSLGVMYYSNSIDEEGIDTILMDVEEIIANIKNTGGLL